MSNTIFIADDDKHILKLLGDYLKSAGYDVIDAKDGEEAIDKIKENIDKIDLIILDVMMPKYSGFEVFKEIRKYTDTPTMFLTALGDVNNEVYGLELGADDYISKPFEYSVILARIKAQLRRNNGIGQYIIGNLKVDLDSYKVFHNDDLIELTNKEFKLLKLLITNNNKALSRDYILDNVWGFNYVGDIRTVDTHIKQLRSKVDPESNIIKTVRGYGYKFER